MSGENYDFTPWDSEDDIAKFFNDDIEKMPFLPALMGAGRAVLGAGKNLVSAGAKKLGLGGAKVGVKGAGAAAETATGAAKTAATSASEAVTSVAPKPTRLPKASDGTESVPLPKTPEAPEAPAASEPPVPEVDAAPEAAAKKNNKQMGMQMGMMAMQGGAQKKQAQDQRAADMARRGATVSTGEPMRIAYQLLKDAEDDDARAYWRSVDKVNRHIKQRPFPTNLDAYMDWFGQLHGLKDEEGWDEIENDSLPPELKRPSTYGNVDWGAVTPFPDTVVPDMKEGRITDYDKYLLSRGQEGREQGNFDEVWQEAEKSEPMDIAYQLLKKNDIPYSSNEHPVRLTSTQNPPQEGLETSCTLCGKPNAILSARWANPIRSQDYTHHMCRDCVEQYDMQSLVHEPDVKLAGSPMDIAYQLLKEEPIHLRNSAELAELARQGDEEAYDEMMRRLEDYHYANEITGETSMENNLDTYGMETGINPYKRPLGYNPPNRHGNPVVIHQRPQTPIHPDKELHGWQYKNASEPMDIAYQLLKDEVDVSGQHAARNDPRFWDVMSHYGKQNLDLVDKPFLPYDKSLGEMSPQVDELLENYGYSPYYFGGKYPNPDLGKKNYESGHLAIFDPGVEAASFGDEQFTGNWRKVHELGHALGLEDLNAEWGEGRRLGKLGTRTPREMLRAVDWETRAMKNQKKLMEEIGLPFKESEYNRDWNTTIGDAGFRAITGKFTSPDKEGFEPHTERVPEDIAMRKVRERAAELGLDMDETLRDKRGGSRKVASEPMDIAYQLLKTWVGVSNG